MKAIVFDMDGVLIDSVEAWRSALNLTLKHFRKRLVLSDEEFRGKWFGIDTGTIFRSLGFKEWLQMQKFAYDNFLRFKDKVVVNPNTEFVLKRLHSHGLKLAVFSTTQHAILAELLEHHGLLTFFDVVLGGDDVPTRKPDPSGILKACSLLGVSPKESLYVGDTNSDILAAKAAGIPLAMLSTTIGMDAIRDAQHKLSSLVELLEITEKG